MTKRQSHPVWLVADPGPKVGLQNLLILLHCNTVPGGQQPSPPPHTKLSSLGWRSRLFRGGGGDPAGWRRTMSKIGCGAMLAFPQLHSAIQQQLPAGTAVMEPALWDVSGPDWRAWAPLRPSASRQLFLLDCDEGQVPSWLGCRVRMFGVNSPLQCGQEAAC